MLRWPLRSYGFTYTSRTPEGRTVPGVSVNLNLMGDQIEDLPGIVRVLDLASLRSPHRHALKPGPFYGRVRELQRLLWPDQAANVSGQ